MNTRRPSEWPRALLDRAAAHGPVAADAFIVAGGHRLLGMFPR